MRGVGVVLWERGRGGVLRPLPDPAAEPAVNTARPHPASGWRSAPLELGRKVPVRHDSHESPESRLPNPDSPKSPLIIRPDSPESPDLVVVVSFCGNRKTKFPAPLANRRKFGFRTVFQFPEMAQGRVSPDRGPVHFPAFRAELVGARRFLVVATAARLQLILD